MFGNWEARFEEVEESAVARSQGLIEWIMDRQNLSNKDLADRLGVSQAHVSQMLGRSPKNLSVKKLARVVAALGDKLVVSSEARESFLRATDQSRMLEFARLSGRGSRSHEYVESLRDSTHANDDIEQFRGSGILKDKRRIWQVHEAA
jgi:transcriptional regulator with XRE-family HTH domain